MILIQPITTTVQQIRAPPVHSQTSFDHSREFAPGTR